MHPFVSLSNQRFRPLWAILTVIVVLSLTLVAWGGSTTTAAASTKAPSLALKKGHVVHTVNIMEKNGRFFFSPATLTIKVGDSVVWKNVTGTTHTVTSNSNNKGGFNSGFLTMNQSFKFTFSRTGTFKYHCNIHLYMHATIIVKSTLSNNQSNSNSPTPTATPSMSRPGGSGGGGSGGGGY